MNGISSDNNDVKVKSQEKALSLVSMHKQPQDHCERPVLGRWFLAPLVPLPARIERERVPFDPDIIIIDPF